MGLFNLFNRQADEQTEVTTDWTTDCAWCLEEQGLEMGNGSHGICEDHSNQVRAQYHQRKFDRVPSYTTRYRDGQQAYWGEGE